jgi:tetratricopeptide (TPR) repeat protein
MRSLKILILLGIIWTPICGKTQTNDIDSLFRISCQDEELNFDRYEALHQIAVLIYSDTINMLDYLEEKVKHSDSLQTIVSSYIYATLGDIEEDRKSGSAKTIMFYITAKEIILEYPLFGVKANLSSELGHLYFMSGMHNESIKEYEEAAKNCSTINDHKGEYQSYRNIARNYEMLYDKNNATRYWTLIENGSDSLVPCELKADILEEKAWDYFDDNDYKKAIKYQNKLIKVNKTCEVNSQEYDLRRLARMYTSCKKYKKALEILDTVLINERKFQSNYGVANTLYMQAVIYEYKKEYPRALDTLLVCIKYFEAEEASIDWPFNSTYRKVSDLYETLGDSTNSRLYLEKHHKSQQDKKLSRYESELKDLQTKLEILTQENLKNEEIETIKYDIDRITKIISELKNDAQ